MKQTTYNVLVTASGSGAGLGELSKYTNKALVKVGRKPAISYIIELYPVDTHFVITLGHFSEHVRSFLQLTYPERHFTFVPVDRYEGPGSSLTYSMLQAAPHLQMPFIYHASDTIVTELPPLPETNWVGGYKGIGSPNYASFDIVNNKVRSLYDKGMVQPDFLHIGLVGIQDYAGFWRAKERVYKHNATNSSIGDMHTINNMIENGASFRAHEFTTWFDTGNIESLNRARHDISDAFPILDKFEESIFLFDNHVVKFFYDERLVRQRVERATILKGLVPDILGSAKNFYKYAYVPGELYATVANPSNFGDFLRWAKTNLWKKAKEVKPSEFTKVCYDFYYTKSLERINRFFRQHALDDSETIINGEAIPPMHKLWEMVDFDWLCKGEQSLFHGDFILDNVIKTDDGFRLLDWRQDFGGLLTSGDMYYDLAKLNHNLTINHQIVHDNLFTVEREGDAITCEILRKSGLVDCQNILFEFLAKEGYDAKKVRLLTAIIWLNMAPLHHNPFDLLLFYFGKLYLWRALNEA